MTGRMLCHVEQAKRVETSRGSVENKPNVSFPRDSSATLGMTENKKAGMTGRVPCHVEQSKRVEHKNAAKLCCYFIPNAPAIRFVHTWVKATATASAASSGLGIAFNPSMVFTIS